MKKFLEKNKVPVLYTFIFVVILALCFLFPYSGDDWAWGSSLGIQRLENHFDNYNGRYLGNLIVLALTRYRIIRNIVMAAVISSVIFILNELTGRKRMGFAVICMCMALMPVSMFSQSIAWTSGFSNYAISILFALIYIFCTRSIYEKEPEKEWKAVILYMLLGFASALVVEHITFYCIVLGIWVIAYCLFKYKKAFPQHCAYLIGTAA